MTERTCKRTIRVRIAVAVDDRGWWNAEGWGHHESEKPSDGVLAGAARRALLNRASVVHFVEVELPVPESETFQGAVVGASEGA